MSLLQGIKKFGGNLLDVATKFGGQQFTPDANPEMDAAVDPRQLAILRQQYDRNFRAQRQQALRNGANWASMNNEAAVAAQPQHESALMRAVAIADQLKQRRLADGRTAQIQNYLKTTTDFTPQQKAALEAMDEGAAMKIVGGELFPNADGNGRATAGTVVSSFKGQNGNIWNVVQTGDTDPEKAVKAIDSGVRDDRRPSEIRTLQSYEDNPQHLDTRQKRAFVEKYGTQAAEFQAQVESTLPTIMEDSTNSIMRMEALKSRLADMPTGRLVGPALEKVSAEMQAINSELTETALMKIGQLKAQGISLNPITVEEMKVLFSTSAQVSNLPAANVKILDRQISILQKIIDQADARLDWIDSDRPVLSYRPDLSPAAQKKRRNDDAPAPPDGFEEE